MSQKVDMEAALRRIRDIARVEVGDRGYETIEEIADAALASPSVPPVAAQAPAQETAALKEGKEVQPAGRRQPASATPGAVSQQPGTAPALGTCGATGRYHDDPHEEYTSCLSWIALAPALPKEEVAPTLEEEWEAARRATSTEWAVPLPEEQIPKKGSAAAPAPGDAVRADDHPGGPLSRAERVLLSNMKREVHRARIALKALDHVIGAVPGSQKIDAARSDALTAINRMLDAFKMRKQGAPMPRARASDATSAGGRT